MDSATNDVWNLIAQRLEHSCERLAALSVSREQSPEAESREDGAYVEELRAVRADLEVVRRLLTALAARPEAPVLSSRDAPTHRSGHSN